MPKAWRLRMKSGAPGVDHAAARAFAFQYGWVGAGWGLDGSPWEDRIEDGSSDAARYLRGAREVYPGDRSLERALKIVADEMSIGDFCWAYESSLGEYWCAEILGDFCYRQGGPFNEFDWHIVRACRWVRVGTADAVPGAIRRAFAGQFGTATELTTDRHRIIDAARFAFGDATAPRRNDLFEAAGPEDLEDLVALYLQSQGWLIYPSTAKVSMANYEFVMVNSATNEKAGVQVKSGGVAHLNHEISEEFDRFFVFLAGSNPTVEGDNRIELISRETIEHFASVSRELLPERLCRTWSGK